MTLELGKGQGNTVYYNCESPHKDRITRGVCVCVCLSVCARAEGGTHSRGHKNPVGASEWACYVEPYFQVSGLEHAWLQLPCQFLLAKVP